MMIKEMRRTRLLQMIFVIVAIVVATLLVKPIRLNFVHLELNHLIFDTPSHSQSYATLLRQTGMHYHEIAGQQEVIEPQLHKKCVSGGSSLTAWLMAIQSRSKKDFAATGRWLLQSAEDLHASQVNLPLLLPTHASPDPDSGDIQLMWDRTYWGQRRDSQSITSYVDPNTQILTLSFENRAQIEDRFAYRWRGPVSFPYWHAFQVVGRLDPGAYLTLEVSTENGLKRYVSYQQGSGEWETFVLPFEGTELQHIYIIVTDSATSTGPAQYQLQLMPITILMEPELKTCIQTQ